MTYSKVHEAWADSPATTTPISAAALDQIEEGVQTAQDTADTATTAVAAATSAAASATAAATAATAAAAAATADAAAATAAATAAVARANHTGTQSSDTLTDGTTSKSFLATERTKLTGIETAATADQTAAELLTAIKTVDGSGSGLDTDAVRGTTPGAFGLTILADGTAAAHRGTLGTGTATSNNFLRGDGSWSVPADAAVAVHDSDPLAHAPAFSAFSVGLLQNSYAALESYATLVDDFFSTNTTTGQIGELGWTKSLVGTGAVAAPISDLGAMGYLNLQASVANDLASISLGTTTLVGPDEFVWAARLLMSSTVTIKYMNGVMDSFAGADPANGAWFQMNSTVDTNVHCRSRNASGVIEDTNIGAVTAGVGEWHIYEITCDGGGNISFSIDGTVEATHGTVPAAGALMSPTSIILGNATAGRNLRVDWHWMRVARS